MLSDQDDLLLWGSPKILAELLGVTVRTVQLYKSGKVTMPEPARRLLRLRVAGDLSALLGSGWEGFCFDRHGLLFVPGWSNGMKPERIRSMFFVFQEAAALRADLKALKNELWAMRKLQALKSPEDGRTLLRRKA